MLSPSAQKVQEALSQLGIQLKVVELPASTRSSAEAAQAIGCTVGQIAKSLVFKTSDTQKPILVIASGANRVDEAKVGARLGEAIGKADADFVRAHTGFVIGGVPPVGHNEALKTFIDEDLLTFQQIWAAAGTPHAVFPLTPTELVQITHGEVIKVC
jgi:prolyl-tRNA editing enzyme YbaK/EbsC (Cys-tRNA(Pro) deacylase)